MRQLRKMIIVLGAHRSGTSLCAAALEYLGADLKLPEHYFNEENIKGFFEQPDVVDFNDRLLSHLDGSWDNPLFDGPAKIAGADLSHFLPEACDLINRTFVHVQAAAIKDPRFCQLLAFWLLALERCGYDDEDIYLVHVLRDPREVALSQQQRAKNNPSFYNIGSRLVEGAALWLSLTAQSLRQTQGKNNFYLSYQDLLDDSVHVLERLAVFVQLVPDTSRLQEFCNTFVDASLHRSSVDPEVTKLIDSEIPQVLEFNSVISGLLKADADEGLLVTQALEIFSREATQTAILRAVVPAVSRLSNEFRAVEKNTNIIQDLEQQKAEMILNTRQILAEHEAVVRPLRAQIADLESGNSQLQLQRDAQNVELDRLSSELTYSSDKLHKLEGEWKYLIDQVGAMEKSTSWKVTKPLRSIQSIQLKIRSKLIASATDFRLRSILIYHRMSVRHPRLAWIGRRVLRPFFRLIKTGRVDHVYSSKLGALLTPMIYQQTEASDSFTPLVSIIVPNYNHAAYLRLRLDSIFSQTYQNFEVIMLDDASTDDSATILREYHQRYPGRSALVINEHNSGGVFHQWERGLRLARGPVVWIAESDDWCTDNFLAVLVPFLENEAIQLAYSRTVFMDGNGEQEIWSINDYLHDIDARRWNAPFVETAYRIVADAFAERNIIPNVSSVIFRNPGKLELLRDPQWKQMQTCGDWVFYLHLIRGGMLAYSSEACNYYRMHSENTSVRSHTDDRFYTEHEIVAKTVQLFYSVDSGVFSRQRDHLISLWREARNSYSHDKFEACFSLSRIRAMTPSRAPNLLMASYAFCAGGGETFPVQLANIMKSSGYNVTYLDCAREPRNIGIRQNLRSDIPLVSDYTQLERIVTDFGIDVIHSHHAWVDNTVLDLLPHDSKCKTVVTLHGMYETINDYDLKSILPRLVERSASLIYVAEKNLTSLRDHKQIDHAALVRIDNALCPEEFEPVLRSDLKIPEDAFVLTLVSRALEDKGWSEAIQAVTEARCIAEREIHLLLVGDGPEYERLRQVTQPDFIHLKGFQRNVRGYFAVADIGFLPSRFRGESFPLVVIECLQAGRPVLASCLGEIPYMLDSPDGIAGILVDLDGDRVNVPLFVAEIVSLASNRSIYERLASRVPAAAGKFDPDILAQKHDATYRNAING